MRPAMIIAASVLAIACSESPNAAVKTAAPAKAKTAPSSPPSAPGAPSTDEPASPNAAKPKADPLTSIEGRVEVGDALELSGTDLALVLMLRPVITGAPKQAVATKRVDGVTLPFDFAFTAADLMGATKLSGTYLVEASIERPSAGNTPLAQASRSGVREGSRGVVLKLSAPPGGPDDPPGAGGPPTPQNPGSGQAVEPNDLHR